MTILPKLPQAKCQIGVPLLANGDRMNQAEFHRRYEQYPDDVKFELVGGIVYMASPLRHSHGAYHVKLSFALECYASGTPGVEVVDNVTTILGEESEPQPDLTMRIVQESGGQSLVNEDEYIQGPPELLAEVAYSSRSIDLNQKRQDYQQVGVLEYLVLSIEDEQLFWFHFPSGESITSNRQGVFKSRVFPGLWIDEKALLALDSAGVRKVIEKGLKSKEHAAFVKRLQRARKQRP
jgi:hypothetical protein